MNEPPVPSVFRSLVLGDPSPAYLLGGEGARLAEMLAGMLVSRFREQGETAELVHAVVADLEKESLVPSWRTPSFFFRRRVFLLPDAGEWKQGVRKEILSYLGSAEPSVHLVIPCADRRTRNLFASAGGIRAASPGEEDVASAMADFAVSLAEGEGKRLSGDAAVFLARWVGSDFPRFRSEMEKLLSFGAAKEEIGEEEIREVCVAGGMVDPFRLADDLMAKNRVRCLESFRRFAAGAETGDYHALVGAISWSVRRKLAAHAKGGTGTGMRPGGKGATLFAARGGRILTAMSRIDRDLKGRSGLTPEQVFEFGLLTLLA